MQKRAWIAAAYVLVACSSEAVAPKAPANGGEDASTQTRDPIDVSPGLDAGRDAGVVRDAGGYVPDFVPTLPPLKPGEPIRDAKPNEWKWVPVPDAHCMGDDSTGMHFNLGDPTKLAILMEGGGACYNSTTCALSLAILVRRR